MLLGDAEIVSSNLTRRGILFALYRVVVYIYLFVTHTPLSHETIERNARYTEAQ